MNNFIERLGWTSSVFFTIVVVLFFSFRIVPVGNLGVVKHWGKVNHGVTLSEGLHLITPIRTTVEYIQCQTT